ncbi:MAG: T9SS type A sorting domain-containing protein, partial [Bacteroidales bacterium]
RYEGPGCEAPLNDLLFNFYTMVGAEKKASSNGPGQGSDFKLLLLEQMVPGNYQPYFNGWSLLNEQSPHGVTIHHPEGDIKKISTYTDTLISTNWGSIPNTHWEVVWAQTFTNWGVTEAGSSGSPIFDSEGRLIGQLTGGEASCSNLTGPDYYGKFWYSWDKNQLADSTMLRPWLDPDNTGVLTLDGLVDVNEHQLPGQGGTTVYPNPTSGDLFIKLPEAEIPEFIRLFDNMGKLVSEINVNSMQGETVQVDMHNMNRGLYFLVIKTKNHRYSHKVMR